MTNDLSAKRVKDEMTKAVVSADPDDSVLEAITTMAEYRLTALPVTDSKNRCIGILSTADLVDPQRWQQEGKSELTSTELGDRKISDLMTPDVESVDRETPLLKATGIMLRLRVHHLPVVDEHQQLLGIISTMDLLSALHAEYE